MEVCQTYAEIADSYVDFIKNKYKQHPVTLVFDGYISGPTTKDNVHLRRTGERRSKDINISSDKVVYSKKKCIPLNQGNKQKVIDILT